MNRKQRYTPHSDEVHTVVQKELAAILDDLRDIKVMMRAYLRFLQSKGSR